MASKSSTSIQQILECSVCQDKMKDPVILQCGHAFCKPCLKQIITLGRSHTKCPLCRQSLTPNERQLRFIPGLIIKSVQEALTKDTTSEKSRGREMCQIHMNNEKKYACEHCRVSVCSECAIEDHWNCSPSSRPKSIDEIKKEMQLLVEQSKEWMSDKNSYVSCLSRVEEDNDAAINQVTITKESLQEAYNTALSNINKAKKEMLDLLSQKKGHLMEDRNKLKTKHKEIMKTADLISADQSHIEEALKRKHPDDIVIAYTTYSQSFKTNLSTAPNPPPSLSATARECKQMYFEKSSIKPYFGKIQNFELEEDEDEEEDWSGIDSIEDLDEVEFEFGDEVELEV